jgi:hypothetical protein
MGGLFEVAVTTAVLTYCVLIHLHLAVQTGAVRSAVLDRAVNWLACPAVGLVNTYWWLAMLLILGSGCV